MSSRAYWRAFHPWPGTTIAAGENGTVDAYEKWINTQNEYYRVAETKRLLSDANHEECIISRAIREAKTYVVGKELLIQ